MSKTKGFDLLWTEVKQKLNLPQGDIEILQLEGRLRQLFLRGSEADKWKARARKAEAKLKEMEKYIDDLHTSSHKTNRGWRDIDIFEWLDDQIRDIKKAWRNAN